MGTKQRADIVMSEAEIADFVNSSRTGTLATIGPDGQPHLTAMWYAVIDGEIWLETKAKSQKAVNLRRDPRVSFLLEDGDTYDTLRGVSFEALPRSSRSPRRCTASGSACGNATPAPTPTSANRWSTR